jgi:hypothetical protein
MGSTPYASIHMYTQGHLFNYAIGGGQTLSQMLSSALDKYESVVKKPIWITETGYSTTSNSVQNTFLTQEMSLILSKSYISGMFWYDLTDWPASTTGYGLWTSNSNHVYTPRTSAFTFAHYETIV